MAEKADQNWPLEPEWLEQIERDKEVIVARDVRRAFRQGLATGIAGSVILMVVVWTLWP